MAPRLAPRPASALALLLSTAAAAQELSPQQLPSPEASPTLSPAPTPIATPAPVPTPSPTPTIGLDGGERLPPIVVPSPRPATPAPAPRPRVPPAAAASPTIEPEPAPTPSDKKLPPIETIILPQPRASVLPWRWLGGGAGLLTLALVWLIARRRHEEPGETDAAVDEVTEATQDVLDTASPLPMAGFARLMVDLRPMRAGLNLISATAECEMTITNSGAAPATDVRASVFLTSAHDGQAAQFADFYADATARPAIPPFALAPGEERRFRAVTALPHDAIHALEAAGRPMFVPLVAVAARYHDGDKARRVGRAFALGIERSGSAKLAPLWLDGPARSYEGVAARAYGEAVEG